MASGAQIAVADAPGRRPAAGHAPAAGGEGGRRGLAVLAALTLLAAALRIATLDLQSFWLDESATVLVLDRSLGAMLEVLPASESSPPLYYLLAWGWTRVFGLGEVGIRLLSALLAAGLVPVAWAAARRAGERAGLWAAAVAALSPLTFYYGQEARVYALLILLAGVAFVAWQRALADPRRATLAAWAVASALALLTHYFAAFLFLPEALWLLWRLGLRRAAPAVGGVAAVGLLLVPLALRQRQDGKSDWIEATSLPSRLAQAPKQFLVGIDGPAETLTALVAGAAVALALAALARRAAPAPRRVAVTAAGVTLAAMALPLAVSLSGAIDVFNGRNVVAAWIPACAVLGVAFAAGRAGAVGGAALLAVSAYVIAGVLAEPAYQRDDWRAAARALPPAAPGLVVATPNNGWSPLAIYAPRLRRVDGSTVTAREVAVVTLRTPGSGDAPLPAVVPREAPPGFERSGGEATEAWAVTRYTADRPVEVDVAALERLAGDPDADVLTGAGGP